MISLFIINLFTQHCMMKYTVCLSTICNIFFIPPINLLLHSHLLSFFFYLSSVSVVNTVLQLAIEEKRQRRISRQNSLLKEATRRYSLVALVSPPVSGVTPNRRLDLGRSKNSKKGSKRHIDGTVSPYSDAEGGSDKLQTKSKSSSSGPGSQNVPGNVPQDVSLDGSHAPAGDGLYGTALPVPRERVTIPSAVPHTHGQTMSESSSAANLTATFGVPLMDSYLDSDSDSEGDETSSGDDNRSRASTMTGTGSTMSVLPKHNKKVCKTQLLRRRI
jgi:hypothetical protein